MTAQETIKSPDPVFQAFQKPQSTVKANDRFSGNADVQYVGKKMQVYGKERRFENEVKASTMQGDESNTTVTMQHNRSSGNVDNSFIKSKYVSTQPFVNDGKNGDGELLKIKQKGGDALNISDGTIKSQNSHMSHSKESENDVFAYTKQLKLMREQYPFLRNIHYEFSTDKDGRVKCKISYFNALDEAKMKIPRKLETAFVASGFDHDESLENAAKIAVTNILDNKVWFGVSSAVTSADNNNFVNGNATINMRLDMSKLDHNQMGDITAGTKKKDFIAGVGQAVGPFDSVPMADVMAPVTAVTAALTTSSPIKKPKKRSTSTGKKEKLENVVMATDLSSIIPPENATSSSPTLSYVSSESSKSSNSSLLESIQQSLRTLFDDPLHSEEDK